VLNDELVPYNLGPPGWCIVILPDGREGFVNEKATRAPVDTHAVVVKRPSGWIITEFWGGLE
jgi:hypothetical protein